MPFPWQAYRTVYSDDARGGLPVAVDTNIIEVEPVAPAPEGGSREHQAILARVVHNPLLPSPPVLAFQIVEKVSDPDCDVREICSLLACDPALCGKLLKIVNSVLYAPRKPITAIHNAITMLGFNRLRSLVLGMSIPAMQFRADHDRGVSNFWKCSVTGAIIARELAVQLRHPAPEDDLVATLLRDLGIILLQQAFPEQYKPVWSGEKQLWAGLRSSWERHHLGVDHAEVSAELLHTWRLPASITIPIRHHHHPHRAASQPPAVAKRARVLDFASRLAEVEDVQQTPDDLREIWRMARDDFGLEPDALDAFLVEVTPKITSFAELLQLDIGKSPHFSAVLSAGCEELVRLSGGEGLNGSPSASRSGSPSASGSRSHPLSPSEMRRLSGESARSTYGPKPTVVTSLSRESRRFTRDSVVSDGPLDPSMDPFGERSTLDIGSRLLNYEIRRIIGRGAMGIVYEAFDIDLNRRVALKTLAPDRATDRNARMRFIREARTAAAVQHENIVTIFSVGEERGMPLLVMEYVGGRSLQEWIDAGRRFETEEVVRLGREIALGLAAAHALRIIHRDIKPANVLLDEESGHARITDFGLARAIDSSDLTNHGTVVGTPHYMSPEQVDNQPLGAVSDLFSLGSLLYALCAGRPPFDAKSVYGTLHLVANAEPPPLRSLNPSVPHWLAAYISSLHTKNPADRLPSAAAAADLLQSLWVSTRSPANV